MTVINLCPETPKPQTPKPTTRYTLYAIRLLGIFAIIIALSSCGFSPLYARSEHPAGTAETAESNALSRIDVATIAGRGGQLLHNRLNDILSPSGRPQFRLDVQLTENIDDFGIRRDTSATFARMTVSANFKLFDLSRPDAQPLVTGTVRAINSYNILQSTFATLSAEEDARARASEQLGGDIRIRLAAYFKALQS